MVSIRRMDSPPMPSTWPSITPISTASSSLISPSKRARVCWMAQIMPQSVWMMPSKPISSRKRSCRTISEPRAAVVMSRYTELE